MAAIWGIISNSFTNNRETERFFHKMTTSMSIFPFDRINSVTMDDGYFACGHQYFTKEDETAVSPIHDEETGIVFCSNCFLYNRNDLLNTLNESSLANADDSQIAYRAFQKWGYSFVENLRGLFSFVIYERKSSCLHLFSDHFSKQYLVYSVLPNHICFSSIYKPILTCLEDNIKINRDFIVNSYRSVSPANFYKEAITPFDNIFHLDYATHITINLQTKNITKERYWNPLKNIKKLKLKNDLEYKNTFISLFEKITKSMLRSKDETGIMLSGGLDSSAVAAFASPLLKKEKKFLYSYTSVPSTGYVAEEHDPYYIVDETSLVESQKNYYDNLIPHFINGDNDSCISVLESFQDLYNLPDKAPFNIINIVNMIKAAKEDNCSILLSGENGNATISYGYLPDYMSLNVTKFHFVKAYREMSYSCKLYGRSRKKYMINWLKEVGKYCFQKPKELPNLIKEKDKKKYGIKHPALDSKHKYGTHSFVTTKQKNNFLIMPEAFIQRGFYYTHLGLNYHFLHLDPTMTVELTEFCLSLPLECFVHHGIERRLVRDYMKDMMPDAITDMRKPRGVQAADIHYRVNRDFDNYKDMLYRYLDEPLLCDYLDNEKLGNTIKELKEAAEKHSLDKRQAVVLTLLVSLGRFLKLYN